MTRSEFDSICDFSGLKDFCYECSCDILDDVYEGCDINDLIDEDIREALRSEYWYTIRDKLNDIPDDDEWYVRRGRLEYDILKEEDFDVYLDEVLAWAELNDIFDEDEDEPAVPAPQEPEFEVDSAVFDALFPVSA